MKIKKDSFEVLKWCASDFEKSPVSPFIFLFKMDFDRFFDDGGFLDLCDDFLRDMLKTVVREMIEEWEVADAIAETISYSQFGFVWIFERFADKIKERTFDAWEVSRNKPSPYSPLAVRPRKVDFRDLFETALKEAAEDIIPIIQTNFFLISQKVAELKKTEEETKIQAMKEKRVAGGCETPFRPSRLPQPKAVPVIEQCPRKTWWSAERAFRRRH
jgi:hypothetical protein